MAGEKAHLTEFGGGAQEHYVHFTLWYDGQTEAQISIRVKAPAPLPEDPIAVYRRVLRRLGEAAQLAGASPLALSWPGDPHAQSAEELAASTPAGADHCSLHRSDRQ
jgi:hypothetical protein